MKEQHRQLQAEILTAGYDAFRYAKDHITDTETLARIERTLHALGGTDAQ